MGRKGRKGWRGVPALFLILTVACSSAPPVERNDTAEVAAERAQKDIDFKNAPDGQPIPLSRRAELLPLAYFPIDPAYKVAAVLRPSDDRTVIDMPTSTGTPRQMRKAGTLVFSLKGQPMQITAFSDLSEKTLDHLTVMFSDLTSGTETYAAGRYLDLDRNATGIYMLDFNRAYHPYCYYNPTYECPYPPPENRLKVPIHAGERMKTPNK